MRPRPIDLCVSVPHVSSHVMRGLQPEHGNVSALAFREPVDNKVRWELVVRRTITAYFSGDTAILRCAALVFGRQACI